MPIERMDHFTIVTRDTAETTRFYGEILGFAPGPRPAFPFPGAWLYTGDKPILHVVERTPLPPAAGVLDHMAFWGTDLPSYLEKLKARGLIYDLRRLLPGGTGAGMWQLFFHDPSGARVEIDFAASETAPDGA